MIDNWDLSSCRQAMFMARDRQTDGQTAYNAYCGHLADDSKTTD